MKVPGSRFILDSFNHTVLPPPTPPYNRHIENRHKETVGSTTKTLKLIHATHCDVAG
jgi:hypothetical protein